MSTHAAPQEVITAAYPDLSPKQRRLAQFCLENEYVIAFESANELAATVGVSPATVVRFCQALGYSGYPDFQAAVRRTLPTALTALERTQRDLGRGSDSVPERALNMVFGAEERSVQRTAAGMRPETLQGAAEALAAAQRVAVVGAGLTGGMAMQLTHTLRTMGIDAHAVTAGGIPLAVELAYLGQDAALVTITIWRYVREVVEAALAARRRGCTCIAITDSPVSPLVKPAHHAFIVSTEGVSHMLALSGMGSVINALTVMLSYLRPQETVEALRQVDEQYRLSKLLLAD